MKQLVGFLSAVLLAMVLSCGQRKKDAAYYEQMVDSIKKAEQLKTMKQQAGVFDDPVEAREDHHHGLSDGQSRAGADVAQTVRI